MRLRPKILLMLTGVFAVSLAVSVAVQRFAVYPRFVALEQDEALEDWGRSRSAIEREIEHLSLLCLDWSSWTDTYNFALGTFPGYYDANIGKLEWFAEQGLDVFYVCRPDGTVVWGQVLDLSTLTPAAVSWLPKDRLPLDHPVMRVSDSKDSEVRGFMLTELGLMMFASRPILTSQNEGPRAGVLVFGRLLSDDAIASLRGQTSVDFTIDTPHDPGLSPAARTELERTMRAGVPEIRASSGDVVTVRGSLVDVTGAPIAVIQARIARHITEEGAAAMTIANESLVGAGVLTLLMLIVGLRRAVISPLVRLTEHVTQIASSGDLDARIEVDRGDELGVLAGKFNEMLTRLEEYRSQAMTMSRQAGMAETATGVLHNVGNALTNANVVAETLSEKFARSKASTLSQAAALLAEHEGDLGRFLSEDARGRQLPAFLGHLADHLRSEAAEHARDLDSLRDGLNHIREIVAAQQDFARCSNIAEPIDLGSVATRALGTVSGSMTRHGITVTIEGDRGAVAIGDRSKVHQVLVNLLSNAKDAICGAEGSSRTIRVRIGGRGGSSSWIEVHDDGVGIRAEDMDKLFANGFSTKVDGHGFGLHYSALAIGEMGGTLRGSSDGPGRGATFRIELPSHAAATQETMA